MVIFSKLMNVLPGHMGDDLVYRLIVTRVYVFFYIFLRLCVYETEL